ncbi:unnamed protein product [Adineta ricciae]|uniref:Uncharacterized protein n=1 Tax=Adineta ricciae TaxID=249248 RepID=A0A814AML2_ADIRI|nr:unnamed protein product [Adineta ricciae]
MAKPLNQYANGKPNRIYKVITTTTTVTCFGEDAVEADDDQSIEVKFVEHVKELGVDTKDVLLHTAANVQHVLETASDYIRTQLSSNSTEDTSRMEIHHEQNDFLHQAAVFKHVLVQKAMDVKDATIDVLRDIATASGQE